MPSARSKHDPLRVLMRDGLPCPYTPIFINELKLTHWLRRKIYQGRKNPVLVDAPRFDKKLAVIVPYRNREQHLQKFPGYLKDFLVKQNIKYELLIIEQCDQKPFNKGALLNIGAANMIEKCDYLCFHDIDMLPENSSYAYVNHPVLLANSVSQFDDNPATPKAFWHKHPTYFGGVVLFRCEDFIKINGFSNNYWHWGAEDDDFFMRCLLNGLTPIAYTEGRYLSLPHEKSITQTADGVYHQDPETLAKLKQYFAKNKNYYKQMRRGLVDTNKDGLNSLEYKLVSQEDCGIYKKMSVIL
jgi:hypothetical protein